MESRLHMLEGDGGSIQGITFDIINCWNVLVSIAPDPSLDEYLQKIGVSFSQVRQALVDQSSNLLKEDGILALQKEFFKMRGGTVSRLDVFSIP